MDFWKSAQEAADRAKSMAKMVSEKGMVSISPHNERRQMSSSLQDRLPHSLPSSTLISTQEFAEATAEEAGKKIKNFSLHDTLGAGVSKEAAHPPSTASLEAYGITPDLLDFIRTLSFATFSDFPGDQLAPLSSSTSQSTTTPIDSNNANVVDVLNSWQVRHASLVVKTAKEVNELRFVLCPRYMTDARFWHIYFTLIMKYLPDEAYTWKSGDKLPEIITVRSTSTSPQGDTTSGISFASLGSQLKQFSSKVQTVAQQTAHKGKLELSTLKSALSSSTTTGSATAPPLSTTSTTTTTDNTESVSTQQQQQQQQQLSSSAVDNTLLGNDPDLEAYLKELALTEGDEDNNNNNDNDSDGPLHQGVEGGDDDLDLDKYLEELTGGGGW